MTEEAKKKRDELADLYGGYTYDHGTKVISFKNGFDAGYQVAMDEANERIQKLREALEFYADRKKWSKQWDEFDRGFSRWCVLYSDVEEINDSVGYCGKTAREALKEDDENLVKIHAK